MRDGKRNGERAVRRGKEREREAEREKDEKWGKDGEVDSGSEKRRIEGEKALERWERGQK
jgi:hypothetical protein